ncbi:MAG: undecaprenyldiphospho-muramoylpentapeptide beta-N-acetylglucosaminyltransferase [Christensenellales bacterium]|jgi:UDP-N-acetylglucosamine--N-acetylmuramyl-(pentapeptide) pyrophosphoryl-undecaprenol N-acetylglucosamine transferase
MGKTIVITGGGTAGHVTPNLALIPLLQQRGFNIHYIGSYNGIEKTLTSELPGVQYHGIASGKLRRYLSLQNLVDPFRVLKGTAQAKKLLKEIQPDVVFSKGGFVSVPVAWAAGHLKLPMVLHESDLTPGLANKLALRCCTRICTTFPETAKAMGAKAVHTGPPIRETLFHGNAEKGLIFSGLEKGLPILLIMGGSSGARAINQAVDRNVDTLLTQWQIIHIRGNDGLNTALEGKRGYAQFVYVQEELPDLLAAADLLLSRAGANAIWEFAALHKPMLLIPLPLSASRGDQLRNAASFVRMGFAHLLDQDTMTDASLVDAIHQAWISSVSMVEAQKNANTRQGTRALLEEILRAAK